MAQNQQYAFQDRQEVGFIGEPFQWGHESAVALQNGASLRVSLRLLCYLSIVSVFRRGQQLIALPLSPPPSPIVSATVV